MQLCAEGVIPAFYPISMSCLDPCGKWRHLKSFSRWSDGVGAFDHMRGLTRCEILANLLREEVVHF